MERKTSADVQSKPLIARIPDFSRRALPFSRRLFGPVVRRWATIVAVLAALSITASIIFAQRLVTVDSGTVQADALVVLGGGGVDRQDRAAELFRTGAAPKILVSGAGDSKFYVETLEKHGVPAAVITAEDRSTNTKENAEFSIPLLRKMGARRVIIVTAWYHSRRALACFEHFAPDISFYSRPSYFGYPVSAWDGAGFNNDVRIESEKLLGYWVRYGVRPYPL
jgi:uncharacterized SAM-binding protein YcdF (DUF218 family)